MANILVTGGSRGIGAAIAKKFAEQGDTVYITYCKSKEAAQALEQQYGIHPIFADFREDFGALKAGKAIAEQIGTIDTLVNNAAISVVDVFQCVSEEDCTALYRVNLFGTVDMTRAILPTMLQQHTGNIINITSVWGQTSSILRSGLFRDEGRHHCLYKGIGKRSCSVWDSGQCRFTGCH